MSLLRWLGLGEDPRPGAPVDSVGAIEKALTDMDPQRARYLAAFAFILGRVARADHDVTDAEARTMERIVAERGSLPAEQAALVVRIAHAEGLRHGGTEDFIATREFERMAARDEKLALIDCLFAVSSADRSIRTVEENAIRQIANELKLEHSDYIAIRAGYAEHLEVLRRRTQ